MMDAHLHSKGKGWDNNGCLFLHSTERRWDMLDAHLPRSESMSAVLVTTDTRFYVFRGGEDGDNDFVPGGGGGAGN